MHPEHPEYPGITICEFTNPTERIDGVLTAKNTVVVSPGRLDRSPCGTGTSAKLAVLHGKGELEVGQWFASESVLGTRFRARIVRETKVGQFQAIVPEVEGSAWITGFPQFVLDPEDPCVHGL